MATDLRFVWLELTARCQLECNHCYAASGPWGSHGTMSAADWRHVIDQAAALGVRDVQFIGGEPTLHPGLPDLIRHALSRSLSVEVYSNLARPLSQELWSVFEQPGVRMATSYYSSDPKTHEGVTAGPPGSHGRTRANIVEALRRSIPLRAGIVEIEAEQDVERARDDLTALGVEHIGIDRLRQVGRGVRDQQPGLGQLCGKCADGVLAVSPDGDVWPCVLSRWLVLGNVRSSALKEIHISADSARSELRARFIALSDKSKDDPTCSPKCDPNCEPSCRPSKEGRVPGCPPMDPKK